MKKIKILVIADEASKANLSDSLRQMLATSKSEAAFIYVEECNYAKNKLTSDTYDVIAFDDFVPKQDAISLAGYIKNFHQKTVSFFLTSSNETLKEIQEKGGLTFCFLKSIDNEMYLYDLEQVNEALIVTGKISYQIADKVLIEPTRVFAQTYADSTTSERLAEEACDMVAKELNANKIKYSATDPDGHVMIISVNRDDVEVVRGIIARTRFGFWRSWAMDYLV